MDSVQTYRSHQKFRAVLAALFLVQDAARTVTLHLGVLSLWIPRSWVSFSSLFQSFMILIFLKRSGQLFCRLPLRLSLSECCALQGKAPQKQWCVLNTSFQKVVMLNCPTVCDVNFDHSAQVASAKFLHHDMMFLFFLL